MRWTRSRCVSPKCVIVPILSLTVVLGLLLVPPALFAQTNTGGGNQGGGIGGNQGGGQGGGGVGGIWIDAKGVISATTVDSSKFSALDKKRREALAGEILPADVNRPSALRKVSLVQLERYCQSFADNGEPLPLPAQFLAGLYQIGYLFVDEQRGDLILAGPADGFAPDEVVRMLTLESGRMPLRLDDLLVALRTIRPGTVVGCSIDPVPERLVALQQYLARNSGPAPVSVGMSRYKEMSKVLGQQSIRVMGVPSDTHFAAAMVEADYRMKLISLGLERPPVKGMTSHLALVRPGANSMQRWWFAPRYESIQTTPERNVFQLVGPRCQLLSEQELVDASGNRSAALNKIASTEKFAQIFTEKFPELADTSPIFGELRNLFDIAVLTALIEREQLINRIGWLPGVFFDREQLIVNSTPAPTSVPTAFSYRRSGSRLIIGLIGGGVDLNPQQVLDRLPYSNDAADQLAGQRIRGIVPPADAAPELWWWD